MRLLRAALLLALSACAREAAPPTTAAASEARDPYPLEHATDAERQLFVLLNGERARLGLRELSWNGQVALVARQHSEAVRDGAGVDLESSSGARVATIAKANFARADTIVDAHSALMKNSRQRANILSADIEQVGVGVIDEISGAGVIVTEILVRAIPNVDTNALARTLRDDLPKYELKGDRDLDALAQRFAGGLAAGKTAEEVWPAVRSLISEIDRRYVKINYSVTVTGDPSEVRTQPLFGKQERNVEIGIGVAQGTDRRIGTGAIWVVLVIGLPLHSF